MRGREHTVYNRAGDPIGRIIIPYQIEEVLRDQSFARMPVFEPMDVEMVGEVLANEQRLPVLDLLVHKWAHDPRAPGTRFIGRIIAEPTDLVAYQMAIQQEKSLEAELRDDPLNDGIDRDLRAATMNRKQCRDVFHGHN